MRKRAARRKSRESLVPLLLSYRKLAINAHAAAAFLYAGSGTFAHWNTLAILCNMLLLGAESVGDADVVRLCHEVAPSLRKLHELMTAGEYHVDEETRAMINVFLIANEDFWQIQSPQLLKRTYDEWIRLINESGTDTHTTGTPLARQSMSIPETLGAM